jgi:hypothetical protein
MPPICGVIRTDATVIYVHFLLTTGSLPFSRQDDGCLPGKNLAPFLRYNYTKS